jgi:preprotein translocase subunit SecG
VRYNLDMQMTLTIIQLLLAILVGSLILMQPKGTGMGRSFGSTSYHSRRGVENLVFKMTIILASLFVIVSVVSQLVV